MKQRFSLIVFLGLECLGEYVINTTLEPMEILENLKPELSGVILSNHGVVARHNLVDGNPWKPNAT